MVEHNGEEIEETQSRFPPIQKAAPALLSGEPLEGIWHDQTGEYLARMKGEEVNPDDFIQSETLTFYALRAKFPGQMIPSSLKAWCGLSGTLVGRTSSGDRGSQSSHFAERSQRIDISGLVMYYK